MRKKTTTRPYSFRLKSRLLRFRLDINSPQQALWNHYLEKKKEVKLAFFEVATLAREQLNDTRHNQTFILDMTYKYRSVQTAIDEIFKLALERYSIFQRQGQAPVLYPHKEIVEPVREEKRERKKLPFDNPVILAYRQKRERQ